MKSFLNFLLLLVIPLGIFLFIMIASEPSITFSGIPAVSVVLIVGFFTILSFGYVYVFETILKSKGNIKKALLIASIFVFVLILVFANACGYIYSEIEDFQITIFQAIIFGCFFILYVAVGSLYKAYLQKAILTFPEKTTVYIKICAVVSAILFLVLIITTSDEIWDNTFNIPLFFSFAKSAFAMSIFIVLMAFASLYLLNKISFFKNKIILTILFATLVCTFCTTIIPFIEASEFSLKLIGCSALSFFTTVLITAVIFYRNLIIRKDSNIASLTNSFSKKESEYLELKNQINPHFLFNNLNTLIAFIELDPQKAIAFGQHLSNVYRHYLKNQSEDFVPLDEELAFISEYLEIYKAKFDSGFVFDISGNINENHYILSAALQELTDNIFKHNDLEEDNPLQISIFVQDGYLVFRNSKHLKPEIASHNFGLKNIGKRYEITTGKNIRIENEDLYFQVAIPILTLEKA
ncbi:sensor histidine kinase [Flavobacterium sp. 3HN19-14]|uniref:sensor histidine kinase n=1 Tax=Flavobacterium sp. 3HN19-14 TaxID=3448133 RepID=UPI003EE41BA5